MTRQEYADSNDRLMERLAAVKDRMDAETSRVGNLLDRMRAAEAKETERRDIRDQIRVDNKVVVFHNS